MKNSKQRCLNNATIKIADTSNMLPRTNMTYSTKAIANWFIETGVKDRNYVDLLKLLKLVYIAQGISLAVGKPLFEEKIQAWPYGPVVQSIYHTFKENGVNSIMRPTSEIIDDGEGFKAIIPRVDNEDEDAQTILKATWENFGKLSGIQLSNWSHESGGPWDKEWNDNDGKSHKNHPMDNQIIADYFKQNFC